MCDADSQTGIHGFWPFSENPEVVCKNSELLTFRIPPCFRVSAEEGADSRKSADSATPPRLSCSVQLLRLITHPYKLAHMNVSVRDLDATFYMQVISTVLSDVQYQNKNELQPSRAKFSIFFIFIEFFENIYLYIKAPCWLRMFFLQFVTAIVCK